MDRRPGQGVTLVELMIAVTVLLLVAAMAWPSYQAQLARSRRADAQQALIEAAHQMERLYIERGSFAGATLGVGGVYPAVSRGGHYRLSLTTLGSDTFGLQATPQGVMQGDACGSFTYTQAGDQGVVGGRLAAQACW